MKTGTLKELNAQPGDVVECVSVPDGGDDEDLGKIHYVRNGVYGLAAYENKEDPKGGANPYWSIEPAYSQRTARFRIVSRASDTPKKWKGSVWSGNHTYGDAPADAPKLWRDMTDAEKGALLLAHYEGKVIECFNSHLPGKWRLKAHGGWITYFAYRVRPPEPKRETVALYAGRDDPHPPTRIGTIDWVDGKPDFTSIRPEEL